MGDFPSHRFFMMSWFGAKMFHVKHFLLQFFLLFHVFCIGSSIRGVDNTKKMPVFCSTNIAAKISLCSVRFAFCKAFPKKEYQSKIASIVGCVSAEKHVKC